MLCMTDGSRMRLYGLVKALSIRCFQSPSPILCRKLVTAFQSTAFPRDLLDFSRAPDVNSASFPMIVVPDFISADEEESLIHDVEPQLRRRRFDDGHFDGVILHYRERTFAISALSTSSQAVMARAYRLFPEAPAAGKHMDSIHAVELARHGEIRNHVDSVKFSGSIVCGISLLSDAIMRLTEEPADQRPGEATYHGLCAKDTVGVSLGDRLRDGRPVPQQIDIRLPRRSLYMLHGESRYKWGHAILGESDQCPRERRISIILRDELVG